MVQGSGKPLPGKFEKGIFMKYMQSIERVPLNEICIEPYQRILNNARVKRIADNFDPARVGVLLLSKRGEHRYAIVDGQHRLCAMRQIGLQEAVCIICGRHVLRRRSGLFPHSDQGYQRAQRLLTLQSGHRSQGRALSQDRSDSEEKRVFGRLESRTHGDHGREYAHPG